MGNQKHDTHKYRDLSIKLKMHNWISWKREIFAAMKDRGLYRMLLGNDPNPALDLNRTSPLSPDDIKSDLEWDDRNNACYNQILLNLSSEIQPLVDPTDVASKAWTLLLEYFESKDPLQIDIVQTYYDHYMVEGQTIMEFVNELNDLRGQLTAMGAPCADSSHGNHILKMLPDSWQKVAGIIRQFSLDPKEVKRRLITEETSINVKAALTKNQAIQALTALKASSQNGLVPGRKGQSSGDQAKRKPCDNCNGTSHRTERCWQKGGALEHEAPWNKDKNKNNSNNPKSTSAKDDKKQGTKPKGASDTDNSDSYASRLAKIASKPIIFMAHADIPSSGKKDIFHHRAYVSCTPYETALHAGGHRFAWWPDSGASCHISHDKLLFTAMRGIDPLPIETANGVLFYANQIGTVQMNMRTGKPGGGSFPVTLQDVLYVPESNINLMSVARMTDGEVNVCFMQERVALFSGEEIICSGVRIGNLYCLPSEPLISTPSGHGGGSGLTPLSGSTPAPLLGPARNNGPNNQVMVVRQPKTLELWHYRFAHASHQIIEDMFKNKLVQGLDLTLRKEPPTLCEDCPFGKHVRAPFSKQEPLPDHPGDIIVSDICGPFEASINGYKYFISWIDLKTRYSNVDFLKTIDAGAVSQSFRRFCVWLHRQIDAEVKILRTDNGGAYISDDFEDLCKDIGIDHQKTIPYVHQHAGVAERFNRTMQANALATLHAANLPTKFWAEAVQYTNFTRNRVVHSRLGITPYKAFWKKKPDVGWLRIFGVKCWALIPKDTRKKGAFRSMEGIFLGYFDDSRAYRVWNKTQRSIYKCQDVIFDEHGFIERVTIHRRDLDENGEDSYPLENDAADIVTERVPMPNDGQSFGEIGEAEALDPKSIEASEGAPIPDPDASNFPLPGSPLTDISSLPATPRPETDTAPPGYEPNIAEKEFIKGPWMDTNNEQYGRGKRDTGSASGKRSTETAAFMRNMLAFSEGKMDLEEFKQALVVLAKDEPANYKAAMKSTQATEWKHACDIEINQLLDKKTWDLVDRPEGINVVGNQWVFRVKRDQNNLVVKYKARLVAQGFSQVYGVDYNETFSPTLRLTTLRFILAFAVKHKLITNQCDIVGAYLNGELDETVYMEQPEGYVENGKSKVCKLRMGLYGLKQSGRQWYKRLVSEMVKLGFKPGDADATVFFRLDTDGGVAIVGWYVDDGLMAADKQSVMDKMIADIQGVFHLTVIGSPRNLLGMNIQHLPSGDIHISQPTYINTITRRLGITTTRPITSPMDQTVDLRRNSGPADPEMANISYASAIGALNYAAVASRPDISYAVGHLAQFSSNPTVEHWKAVKRVARYLLTTRELGITFRADGNGIEGYADADFASDIDDRRSTTGWVFLLNGAPICWSSKKQNHVTRSSMESETVAGSFASAEGIWLIRLADDFNMVFRPIPLYVDNQSSLAFAKNDANHNRTKHIDVHYRYTREQVQLGNIDLHFVPGIDNPADVLTKALAPKRHQHMLDLLGMMA